MHVDAASGASTPWLPLAHEVIICASAVPSPLLLSLAARLRPSCQPAPLPADAVVIEPSAEGLSKAYYNKGSCKSDGGRGKVCDGV